jgi:hypothetical protein
MHVFQFLYPVPVLVSATAVCREDESNFEGKGHGKGGIRDGENFPSGQLGELTRQRNITGGLQSSNKLPRGLDPHILPREGGWE